MAIVVHRIDLLLQDLGFVVDALLVSCRVYPLKLCFELPQVLTHVFLLQICVSFQLPSVVVWCVALRFNLQSDAYSFGCRHFV